MKHVLITGGTDGIGKITAGKLVAAGYAVTILGRDEQKATAAAKEIGCAYVVADVTDFAQVEKAMQQAEDATGAIDILINNAGIWQNSLLAGTDPERIKRVIETNTLGTMYPVRAVVQGMQTRKKRRIINVISQAGLQASPNRTIYHASKWAITGFTKALQQELRADGISVVGYYPGAMATQFFAKAGDMKDRSRALSPDVAADTLVYLCGLPDTVELLEFGVQSLEY